MHIGLIIPPSIFLSDQRWFMHIGILKVAAVLEKVGHQVDVLDFSGVENFLSAVRDYININPPEVIGITATSPQMPAAMEIAKAVRSVNPSIRLMLGGPHATLVHVPYRNEQRVNKQGRGTHALKPLLECFDTIVVGDGEDAILTALANPTLKIVDADDLQSPHFLSPGRLAELPFPARHLVDVGSYHYTIDGRKAISMIAQLGCPFHCGFCGGRESPFLRKIRIRPTENVIAEMRELYERYGVDALMFYDDELNVNRAMIPLMEAIATLGKELGIEWRLRGFIKAELFTEAQAVAMQRAGFREILTGFESGSPRILLNIRKESTQEDNSRCIDIARRNGLRVKALMSIGHPGESATTVQETKDWILRVKPDSFDITRITVYPGTPYFDRAIECAPGVWKYSINGDSLYSPEVDFTTNYLFYKGDRGANLGLNQFFAWTDELSAEGLADILAKTEQSLRAELGQPFQTDAPVLLYEHSMGQGLPGYILRSTNRPTH